MLHRPSIGTTMRKCEAPGCNLLAGTLGFCGKHAVQHIDAGFDRAVQSGHALQDTPKCFSRTADYREYVVLFMASMVGSGSKARNTLDYCRDCNPKYQQQMLGTGRCAHPETVFIRDDKTGGDLTGVSSVDLRRWETSVIGSHGPVVRVPPEEIVNQILEQIGNAESLKRKPGRPKKVK